jgi:pheromone a factor receptor
VPLVFIWPVILSTASLIYASTHPLYLSPLTLIYFILVIGLTIRALIFNTRRQFSGFLSDSATVCTISHYFRLMALAVIVIFVSLPLSLFFLVAALRLADIEPWVSWDFAHQEYRNIIYTSYELLEAMPASRTQLDINRWITPGGALLFFMHFGLSKEATQQYRRIFWRIAKPLGIQPPAPEPQWDN